MTAKNFDPFSMWKKGVNIGTHQLRSEAPLIIFFSINDSLKYSLTGSITLFLNIIIERLDQNLSLLYGINIYDKFAQISQNFCQASNV